MTQKTIFFAHGLESGPNGSKIQMLVKIAKAKGYVTECPDYSGMQDPNERVTQLLGVVPKDLEQLILVGSSMGAWVSLKASAQLHPHALFLLAPTVYVGYKSPKKISDEAPTPHAQHTEMIHGWHDEIVPVDKVIRFAKDHQSTLHLVNDGHRLINQLPVLSDLFSLFLDRMSEVA